MRRLSFIILLSLSPLLAMVQVPHYDKSTDGFLVFHPIKTDSSGKIISWYSEDNAKAYDFVINATWRFWDTMRYDINGLPYYMNHQVWRPENDPRGLGGDQLAMALSSWQLLYMYNGNEKVKENMKFIADYYLTHSLSPANSAWPNIPFPYNTFIYSGIYDGDMVIGKGYTQPDKAGSFGIELVKLFKITNNINYLKAAIDIANTLAKHTQPGDGDHSPMPFKVNVQTGETGKLMSNLHDGSIAGISSYTTNWVGTLQLFGELTKMKKGNVSAYTKSSKLIIDWMKKYPLKTDKWGPFFEDVPGWSDTQINAVTFALYMMDNRNMFPDWKTQVRQILDWVYHVLGNDQWKQYGVQTVNEQTAYKTPGNSHTSRQAAAELKYTALTGDQRQKENAIRQLNWCTYMVDVDGKNNYPRDEVWMTDGYGDYIRHFLRAMATDPSLAPGNQDHILSSTSIIYQADYAPDMNKNTYPFIIGEELEKIKIYYKTYDKKSTEIIRLRAKPLKILLEDKSLPEDKYATEGWSWEPFQQGGVLTIRHEYGIQVKVF
ncbi:MAG: hypothetical protein ABI687_12140 [Flavitalea sp.]